MSGLASMLAAIALLPAMTGPADSADGGLLSLALCGGGTVTVPVRGEPGNVPDKAPCAKGCHSGGARKRIDFAP